MKILLIYPTQLDDNNKPTKYKKAFLPPLSLSILNSLTPENHSVTIINEFVEYIDYSIKYDLVGITAMTTQIERAYQIADIYRARNIKVILGGVHPTFLPDEAKKHADSVVIGEAETLWPQIILDCENNILKEFYKETSYPSLNELIIPKWNNFNLSIYPKKFKAKLPRMPIFTTRGCPNDCTFCSVTKFFGRTYRTKPIANILSELDHTKAESYFFVDDNIACNYEYSKELFSSLVNKNIRWFSQISTTVLKHPDLIELAAKAGCTSLFVGIESINSKNLNSIKKNFNKIDQYEELIKRMHSVGIKPYISLIFGLDEDTAEQIKMTMDFLKRNKIFFPVLCIYTPLPGTELFSTMEKNERITNRDWSRYNLSNVVFEPTNFSKESLHKIFWESYQEIYTIPNCGRALLNSLTISKNPIRSLLSTLYSVALYRNKVYSFEHPYSGGFFKKK